MTNFNRSKPPEDTVWREVPQIGRDLTYFTRLHGQQVAVTINSCHLEVLHLLSGQGPTSRFTLCDLLFMQMALHGNHRYEHGTEEVPFILYGGSIWLRAKVRFTESTVELISLETGTPEPFALDWLA